MAVNMGEIKTGFWLGLGLILAFTVVGLLQLLAMKAAKHE